MTKTKLHSNISLIVLTLAYSGLPFTSSANGLKTQDIKLGMDNVCGVKVTQEGDIYAAGYNSSNRKQLLYKILQQNFSLIYEGAIESPDGGMVSCSSANITPGNITPGKDDDFFIPANWVLSFDGGYTSTGYVHHVKFKDNQSSFLLKKDDIHFDKVFLGKDTTKLYVSSYRTWSTDRHSTSIAEINLDDSTISWEKDFLLAPRGSIVSPDKSMIYLISKQKGDIISLSERRVIDETPYLIDGFASVIDDDGSIYGTGREDFSQPGLSMAKIQPFSSSPDKVLWQMPYPVSSVNNIIAHKKLVPGPDEAVYFTAISKKEGPGIQIFDMKEKMLKTFISLPDKNAWNVSHVIFDKDNTQGYVYTETIDDSENGRKRGYAIWSFSPETKKAEILTRFMTDDHRPKGFNLINNRLIFILNDTIHILPLGAASEEYQDTGLAISGTLPEEQGTPLHSHRHITWQVNSADGKVLDSGTLKLPAADPDMLGITAWPLRLAEAINRSGGALKAGEMESGVITPLASSYRNHFWLPEGEKWQGATVRLTFLPSETADEKWHLNNRADSALPVSLVTSEQSVLPEKMVFQLSGKKSGTRSTLEIDGLNTQNRFTWAMEVSQKVNAKSEVVKLGELSADGAWSVSPLASQYRNRLWVASDGDVEVTGCTPAVFCQTGN